MVVRRDNDFKVLRWKGPDATNDVDANDPDWSADMANPNSGRYIVAGTATAGDYGITCTPIDTGFTASSVTFTRVAESNTAIATAIFNAINTDVAADTDATGIARFIRLATNPSAGVVHIVYTQLGGVDVDFVAAPFAESPGTFLDLETANNTSGNRFPCTRSVRFERPIAKGSNANIEILVAAINSSRATLADDNACTYTIEFLEVVPRLDDDLAELEDLVVSRGTTSGATLDNVHTVNCDGSHQFGVRLSSVTNVPTGTDRLEVLFRESRV